MSQLDRRWKAVSAAILGGGVQMGTTYYHTVNGMIIGETRDGVRRMYLPDAAGSVVATVDDTGALENRYWYKPFGGLLAKTGSAADPKFLFMGALGLRSAELRHAEIYDKFRNLDCLTGRWISLDVFSDQYSYVFMEGNPTSTLQSVSDWTPHHALHRQNQGLVDGISGLPSQYSLCAPGYTAWTACQYDQGDPGFGKPYSVICITGCAKECTRKHEEVHRGQTAQCCANTAKCVAKWPRNQAYEKCRKAYISWYKDNEPAFECDAYTVSCKCFKDQLEHGGGGGGGPVGALCCGVSAAVNMQTDCHQRDVLCNPPKPIPPCPFDENGNPRKKK